MTDATDTTTDAVEPDAIEPDKGAEPELNEGGKRALAAERQARREAEKQLKDLTARIEAFEDANKSDLEKAQKAASKATEAAAERERERDDVLAKLTRFEVAQAKGISGDAVELLTGSDRETIEAQADRILALIEGKREKDSAETFPIVSAEGKTPAKSGTTADAFAEALKAFNF